MGAVGGLVAGAFAMHEGEKIKDHYEYDKDRMEGRIDRGEYRAEDRFDYDRHRIEGEPWEGRRVERVEEVPYGVRYSS